MTWIIDFINKNPSLIVAVLALFISILALAASIFDGYKRRKHDRLSVQPLLEAKYEILDKCVEVFIENVGVGIAKIIEYYILVDEKQVDDLNEALLDLFREKAFPESTIKLERFSTPKFIRPNERIIIFFAYPSSEKVFDNSQRHSFLELVKRFTVLVVFESIYKEIHKIALQFDAI